jgi:hypothetical protein
MRLRDQGCLSLVTGSSGLDYSFLFPSLLLQFKHLYVFYHLFLGNIGSLLLFLSISGARGDLP